MSIFWLLIRGDWLDPIYFLILLLLSRVMKVPPAPASSVCWHIFCSNRSEYCLFDHSPALQTLGPGAVTRARPASLAWAGAILGRGACLLAPELVRVQRDGHLQMSGGDHWVPGESAAKWCEETWQAGAERLRRSAPEAGSRASVPEIRRRVIVSSSQMVFVVLFDAVSMNYFFIRVIIPVLLTLGRPRNCKT